VTALDLDEMSGGRFVLGLERARRRMRTDWLGAPAERPARRVREVIEAIRAVWAACEAGSIEYEGELVRLAVRPYGRGRPAARLRSRSSLRRQRRYVPHGGSRGATAWSLIRWRTTRYIDEVMRPAIAEGAEREGRRSEDVRSRTGSSPPSPTIATVRDETAKRQIAFHADGAHLRPHPSTSTASLDVAARDQGALERSSTSRA
jgi:alkanesulfonate monooxygenase SsuD/methylene tetrahydromethanopterin reductase-like flavin-dependent oxidoreductase (luciferase family)